MNPARQVPATFARRPIEPDRGYEREHAAHLAESHSPEERLALFDRFRNGQTRFDATMRRIVLRSLVKSMGQDVTVGPGFGFLHPHTFEIGDGVFFAAGVYLQGRHDGTCRIGTRCWIGPGAYFDARDLVLDDFVGWGPAAKVLGSEHTGEPRDLAVIETDLRIAPVRVGRGADVGTNAVIMPGVTIGANAIVGAGAVVTHDVEPFHIVAGVPAKPLRDRRST
jgi:acetyltransferase-like isoleucine patch superfamily enzyme